MNFSKCYTIMSLFPLFAMKLNSAPGVFLVGSACWVLLATAGAAPPGKVPAAPVTPKPVVIKAAELAEIMVPKEPLGTAAALEVRFPSPMISAAGVGEAVDAANVLEIKPAWRGKFRWQSTRSGTLDLEGLLPLGDGWRIALKKGLKNLAGQPVEATPVLAVGQPLVVRESSPRYFSPGSESTRQPEITLFFNDAVNPAAVVNAGYFANKQGVRVAVTARTPLVAELGRNPGVTGTWEEQAQEGRTPVMDTPAVSVVRVKPVTPLPLGTDWRFQLEAGVTNAPGQARTLAATVINYGSIAPLVVNRVRAEPVLDGGRELHLNFNKKLAELKPEQWADAVKLNPRPEALTWEASGQSLTVKGGFQHDTNYEVIVPAGLLAADGTRLESPWHSSQKFEAHAPQVSLPAFDHAQWIGGKGEFSFSTANLKKARVQIKRATPETVVFLLNGYATYEYDESHPESSGHTRLPWPVVPGKSVWEKEMPTTVKLDQSESFGFKWDEVLGGKRQPGIYFVNVEGEAKDEVTARQTLGAQAVVQLSDIGLAWKYAGTEALIYAFSHTTGAPLKEVTLRTYTPENEPAERAVTGADGMARLSHGKVRWLIAQAGEDLRGVRLDGGAMEMDRWAYDLPVDDSGNAEPAREMMLFTERPVYQPGETVFFKAITRMHQSVTLTIPEGRKAKLTLLDPQNRPVMTRDIEFTGTGSFADAVRLPGQGVGWYRLRIEFPKPGAPMGASAPDEEADGEASGPPVFEQMLLVQEYQPNAFRITFDEAAVIREAESLKVPLKASYLMGKALGAVPMTWTSRLSQAYFRPDGFDDYRFCHAKSYYVYDGEQYQSMTEEAAINPLLTGQGSLKLTEKGEALIEAKLPATFGVPGPKLISVSAEITDLNQQTIAKEWQRTEHSSDFYLGVRRPVNAVTAGTAVPISLVAVNHDGKRRHEPVAVKLLVEHLTWNAVRVQTAGGGSEVRNDLVFATVGEAEITVSPEPGKEEAWTFEPKVAGTHNLTFTTADASGRPVRTVVSIDVYAPREAAWQQGDGVKTELLPDKDEYQPGETARVVVKSPFSGTALVTVERDRVLYSTLQQVEAGGSIELLVDEAWAPNVFVSVLQVRGGAEDPREHKQPDYRVGYAQLKVASKLNQLMVELKPALPEVRPGGIVEVSATVRDSQGNPVPDAELAVWAVDEGILSLMPWEVPDPAVTFHYDNALAVRTGVSLQRLLPEDPEKREFANKGFVIGGGGDTDQAGQLMRKDFKPTAYWHGMLRTGADGVVKLSFPAPDNLTEFRLAAVACEGTARFGHAENRFKVNQPLMLEPALPRFANVGDIITLKAVVHNTTEQSGDIAVLFTADEHVTLLDPANGKPLEGRSLTRTVSLAAQQSKAVAFPVRFIADGPLTLQWKANCATVPLLADAVESKFTVGFAEPLLREVQFFNLTSAQNGVDLLAKVRPELLEGTQGKVTVTLANSRVIEGAQAVLHLLHYPYGCAEQTMSSLLPWLTLRDLKQVLPDLNRPDEEIVDVIQRGCDRLLSMQTEAGGLAYWPGGEAPSLWASSHGTLGLVLASRCGANVPAGRLDALTKWLSESLREAGDADSWALTERAYAAYALALAGKGEPGYHELLFGKRQELSPSARALLALAIAECDGPPEMAKQVLAVTRPDDKDWWWGSGSAQSMRVMALLKLKDPAADAEMGRLLASRSPRGDWRNTISNAWVLMALSREATLAPAWQGGQPAVLTLDGKTQEVTLPATPASQTVALDFKPGAALPSLTATLPAGQRLFAKIEISSRAKAGPQPARQAGFGITRAWKKIAQDGSLSEAGPLHTGDLVQVSLKFDIPSSAEYLVIDDPLPATFEAVNANFTSMASAEVDEVAGNEWFSDFSEIRRDRVLFFRDSFEGKGTFRVSYLARVVAEGTVTVPASRIEMMYDPARFGLSPSQTLTTEASPDEAVAGR